VSARPVWRRGFVACLAGATLVECGRTLGADGVTYSNWWWQLALWLAAWSGLVWVVLDERRGE